MTVTVEPAIYVTSTTTDTVHMMPSANWGIVARTFCGLAIRRDWPIGDETLSGVSATCGTCKRVHRG